MPANPKKLESSGMVTHLTLNANQIQCALQAKGSSGRAKLTRPREASRQFCECCIARRQPQEPLSLAILRRRTWPET